MAFSTQKLDFVDEEGRESIYKWSERRRKKIKGIRKSIYVFRIFAVDLNVSIAFSPIEKVDNHLQISYAVLRIFHMCT